MSAPITRTVTLDDLTPQEVARLFTNMDSDRQAEFFGEVWRIARDWPGAGWCMQSCYIAAALDSDGRNAIETLAGHVMDKESVQ